MAAISHIVALMRFIPSVLAGPMSSTPQWVDSIPQTSQLQEAGGCRSLGAQRVLPEGGPAQVEALTPSRWADHPLCSS